MKLPAIPRWLSLVSLALLAGEAGAAGVHVRLQTAAATVAQNQEFDVELRVFQADDPFNAFDAAVRFDPARLTFVAPPNPATQQGALMTAACANRFHLFSAAPDSLKINLSLLCSGVTVTGPGVIYKVRLRAGTQPGPVELTFGPSTRFYRGGFFVDPLETQSLAMCIENCTTDASDAPPAVLGLMPPSPNPWRPNQTARFAFVTAVGGPVRLEVFDLAGRRVAERGPEWCGAGRHEWTLSRPRDASGIGFARLVTPDGTTSRTIVLVR